MLFRPSGPLLVKTQIVSTCYMNGRLRRGLMLFLIVASKRDISLNPWPTIIEQRDIGVSAGLHCWFTVTNIFWFFIFLVRSCFAQHALVEMPVRNKQWSIRYKHMLNKSPKVTFYLRIPLLLPYGLSSASMPLSFMCSTGLYYGTLLGLYHFFKHDTVEWGQYEVYSFLCFTIFCLMLVIRNGTLEIFCWLIAWSPGSGLASVFDFPIPVQL